MPANTINVDEFSKRLFRASFSLASLVFTRAFATIDYDCRVPDSPCRVTDIPANTLRIPYASPERNPAEYLKGSAPQVILANGFGCHKRDFRCASVAYRPFFRFWEMTPLVSVGRFH
jgi:hypothetical protein